MISEFASITQEESEEMLLAPVRVALLIAGADNEIDKREKEVASTFTKFRKEKAPAVLRPYYTKVSEIFDEKMEELVQHYPSDAEERNPMIAEDLKRLNDILPQLNHDFALSFKESMKGFAKAIAEASGGLLSYFSVSKKEQDWLALDMIKYPEE